MVGYLIFVAGIFAVQVINEYLGGSLLTQIVVQLLISAVYASTI